ncbi:MAG: flagellar biosynthesis protein FlhB [Gammaproteobacteria bacterium]|nr:flagellar biosynthesis protein FlhB [Gammaproteobacteria bacterium]
MAEQQFQERTEQATPKRKEEARRKGQVARSRELNMALVMIGASIVMFISSPAMARALLQLMRDGLTLEPAQIETPAAMATALGTAAFTALGALAPLLVVVTVAAVAGGIAIGGWSFSFQALEPKLSKLDPIKGLKRVFGLKGLVEVAKALGKAGVVGGAAFGVLYFAAEELLVLSMAPLREAVMTSGTLMLTVFLAACVSLLVIAAFDVPFQLWNHAKELRMTRKEVQDELKETEGRPEVRSKIRNLQQEMANRRMLRDVPDADVIITNPSHFSVALRYDDANMNAPVVVAKGVDHMAAKIREIGELHNVVIFEAPPLARAVYWTTEVGQIIPEKLYVAVAQVLTYVMRLKAYNTGQADYPDRPLVDVADEYPNEAGSAAQVNHDDEVR